MTDTKHIPPSKLETNHVSKNANTKDIIDSILRIDSRQDADFCKFANQFADGKKGLKRLHSFVRNRIRYKADGHKQIVKAPAALWRIGQGDCKSMTLFINKVLQCLNIPYIIRFTNYENEDNVKHVYTVAILDGEHIPVDAVYHRFDEEKPFTKKIDYYQDMAELIEITGFDFNHAEKMKYKSSLVKNNCEPPTYYTDSAIIQKQAELKQKQKDVEEIGPVQFHKITEGQAMLEIALQELHTIRAMQPERRAIAQDGINRIVKALKGNTAGALMGVIPCELYGLAEKIKMAPHLTMAANSFGYNAKKLEAVLKETHEDGPKYNPKWEELIAERQNRIGQIQWPTRVCLLGMWFLESSPYTYQQAVSFEGWNYPASPGLCGGWDLVGWSNQQNQTGQISNPAGIDMSRVFYGYGRDSEYRVNALQYAANFNNSLGAMDGTLVHGIGGAGGGPFSVWINSQADWVAVQDILNQNSGVTSNYINDIYKPTRSTGTMGSGLLYTFTPGMVTPGGNQIGINQLPNAVVSKRIHQGEFNDSVNIFSGVSPSSIQGMSRSGVIFDNGKQPETTLNELYSLYLTPTDVVNGFKYIEGIGYVPVVEIIAAIGIAIAGILTALAEAGVFSNKAKTQAPLIDQSASDNAQFTPLTPATMPNGDDWLGGGGGGGLIDTGDTNQMLLLGGAALLAYAATRKNKKK